MYESNAIATQLTANWLFNIYGSAMYLMTKHLDFIFYICWNWTRYVPQMQTIHKLPNIHLDTEKR